MPKIILLLLCLSSVAVAQDTVDTSGFDIVLDDYIITAQYEPTHYKEVMHNVTVINKNTIANRAAVTLDEIITMAPSVRLVQDPILGTSIRMRGISSSNVAILRDGVPIIGRQNGSIDITQISLQNVERIEVVEGPMSNIYGSNAAGGVINIITKKSQKSTFEFNSDNLVESTEIRNNQATLGYKKKNLMTKINARSYRFEGFPIDSLRLQESVSLNDSTKINQIKYPYNPKNQLQLGGLMRYDFNANHQAHIEYQYNHEFLNNYGVVKRAQFNPYAEDNTFTTTRSDLALHFKGEIGSKVFIDATTAYNKYDRITESNRLYLETQQIDTALQTIDTNYFSNNFTRINVAYRPQEDWTIMSGINHNYETGGGDRIKSTNTEDSTRAVSNEIAAYTEIKYAGLDKLQLSASGRWTYHNIYRNQATFALHGKYAITDEASIRLSYAQGYRSPSLKELYLEFVDVFHNIFGNVDLKPEFSHDLQATFDMELLKGIDISFNAYRTTISDRINLTQTDNGEFYYDNIDSYDVYGFQPSMSYRFNNFNVNSSASLSYWSSQIDEEDVPDYGRIFDMNNSVTYKSNFLNMGFTLNHRHVGSIPTYRENNGAIEVRRISAYNLLDLTTNKSILNNKVTLVAGVKNLLNIVSISTEGAGTGSAHGGAARNVIGLGRSLFIQASVAL